ncbi:MAG: hypothetical protein ACTTKP_06510 [Catonella sp.]|jgi:hypothetical protein|uniref:hypothetical protein n=1 Tax=Catonella sp. TaxID=2382125 RepID=UPI003FA1950E
MLRMIDFSKAVKYYKPSYDNVVVALGNNKYEIFYENNDFGFIDFILFPYVCPDCEEYEQIKEITKEEYMLELAKFVSENSHKNQIDKAGIDYFAGHIQAVVNGVTTNKEKIVAYLHDTVEDTPLTIERIKELFGEEIGEAVFAITKSKDGSLSYDDYIERVKANPLARAVKISDLKHNMDLSRLEKVGITEKDIKRAKKYQKALKKLQE